MVHVSVTIDGKTYRVACDEGQQEHLVHLGERLDQMIQMLKDDFGEVGDQRLAIMAGIMMSDKLSESEKKVRGLEAEVDALKENRNALIDRFQGAEETISRALLEVTERVTKLTHKLKGSNEDEKPHVSAAE